MLFSDISGKWLGSRQIHCNWVTEGANANDDNRNLDSKSIVELTSGTSGEIMRFLSKKFWECLFFTLFFIFGRLRTPCVLWLILDLEYFIIFNF